MAEEKEVLTEVEEKDTTSTETVDEKQEALKFLQEENVEDYFNPFADVSKEDKQIEEEIEKEDKEKEVKEITTPIDDEVRSELAQVKAEREASREVNKFIKENPEFSEMGDDLVELASKAMVRGHSKPVEFAVRNVKSPSYWIDYGKKIAREDLVNVSQNRIGGSSLSKGENKGTPDFNSMSSEEFNDYYRSVVNNA